MTNRTGRHLTEVTRHRDGHPIYTNGFVSCWIWANILLLLLILVMLVA